MTDAWKDARLVNEQAHVSYSALAILMGILKQMEQVVSNFEKLSDSMHESSNNLHMHLYEIEDDLFEINYRIEKMEERNYVYEDDDEDDDCEIDEIEDDVQF